MIGLITHDGGHGAIGNVDAGVADAAPQQIGHEHVDDAQGHGQVDSPGLVHQEGGQSHGTAGSQQPGTELAVLCCLGLVADAAHGGVGEGIDDPGDQEHGANQSGVDAEDIGVEHLQVQACENEGEVIGHIAQHVADFVPYAEGTQNHGGFAHGIRSFSKFFVYIIVRIFQKMW